MRYKIPQNIDVEDRVVGPLTVRQFIILFIGAGIIVLLFFSLQSILPIFILFSVVVGLAAMFIAFFDYGGMHFERIISGAINYSFTPRSRVWKKIHPITTQVEITQKEIAEIPKAIAKKYLNELKREIETYAYIKDTDNDKNKKDKSDLLNGGDFTTMKALNELLKAAKAPKRKEPLISDLANISPKKNYDYKEIEVLKDRGIPLA